MSEDKPDKAFLDMCYWEVIPEPTLTREERAKVNKYLAAKWGIDLENDQQD